MTDSDGFDLNDPFKLPRMNVDLQPLDLVLVYFTVSSRPYRPPMSEQGQRSGAASWGGAARPGSLKGVDKGQNLAHPDQLDFNLFGAVKLASRSDS